MNILAFPEGSKKIKTGQSGQKNPQPGFEPISSPFDFYYNKISYGCENQWKLRRIIVTYP